MSTRAPVLPRTAWTPDRIAGLLQDLGEKGLRDVLDLQLLGWDHQERRLRQHPPAWWRQRAQARWRDRLSRVTAGRAETLRRVALLEQVLAAWREAGE